MTKSKAALWTIPLAAIFLWLGKNANETFVSKFVYDSLSKIILIALLVCSVRGFMYVTRWYRAQRDAASPQFQEKLWGPLSHLLYATFRGLILGLLALMSLGAAGMSLVRATAWTPVQFYAPISVTRGLGGGHGGRACQYDVTFYNQPVGRDVMLCAEHSGIGGVTTGETLLVTEDVGPLGAHIISLNRLKR